jgi:hypothetical protein
MSYVARSQSHEAEWKLVSEKHPCPICESVDICHRDLEGAFACCGRRPSDWPLTSGAWLHRIESESESETESERSEHLVTSARVAAFAGHAENHNGRSPMRGSTS